MDISPDSSRSDWQSAQIGAGRHQAQLAHAAQAVAHHLVGQVDQHRLVLGQGVDEHDAGLELLVRGDALRGPVDDGLFQDIPGRGTMELLTDYI